MRRKSTHFRVRSTRTSLTMHK